MYNVQHTQHTHTNTHMHHTTQTFINFVLGQNTNSHKYKRFVQVVKNRGFMYSYGMLSIVSYGLIFLKGAQQMEREERIILPFQRTSTETTDSKNIFHRFQQRCLVICWMDSWIISKVLKSGRVFFESVEYTFIICSAL